MYLLIKKFPLDSWPYIDMCSVAEELNRWVVTCPSYVMQIDNHGVNSASI